jgi:two-component system, sensor histidine kinase and response regulator
VIRLIQNSFDRLPFRWKAILFIATVEGIFNIMFAFIVVGVMQSNLEEQFFKRAEITAQLFATTTANAVLATDIASLESFIGEVMKNEDLLYARVRDTSGVLAERSNTLALLARPFKADRNLGTATDDVFDTFAAITVDGEKYGQVEIGLSTNLLGSTIRQIQLKVILIGAGEILFSAIVSFLLGTFLVRRLIDLQQGAHDISEGKIGLQIPAEGQDELAETAKSFNNMSTKLATVVDELRQSNTELHVARGYLQKILDTALTGIIVIDDSGIVESFNPHAEIMFGYSADEVVGRNISMVMPEPDASSHDEYIRTYLETGHSEIIGQGREVQGKNKHGEAFPMWLAVNELQLGGKTRFVGSTVDLSQIKATAKEAAKSESKSRAVLSGALDAVVMIGGNGDQADRIISWNERAEKIFGWTAEEAIGRNIAETIIPPALRDAHRAGFERYLKTREPNILGKRLELEGLRKDGTSFPCEITVTTSGLPDNEIFFAAFIRDITKQKAAGEALHAAKEEAEFQRRSAEESRDLAEQASQAKSEFLNMVSHELRTPTQGLKGPLEEFVNQFPDFAGMLDLSDILRDLGGSEHDKLQAAMISLHDEVTEIAEGGLRSAEHLLNLINEILDYGKLESGKLVMNPEPLLVVTEAASAVDIIRTKIADKGLELRTEIPLDLQVFADPMRLKQILLNLLGNAEKFTEAGSITLSAALDGEWVQFSIEDTGCGIPEDMYEVIFNAFEQVDASLTRQAGGTGLGLPLTRGLVISHGGRIWVEGTEGVGSTFHFTLPATEHAEV